MRDDQLTRLFRALDGAADPEPAFADALFDQLRRETRTAGAGRRGPWVTVLAAALLLTAILAGALVVGGAVKLPWLVVNPEESPTPQASPLASTDPSAGPSEDPSLAPALPDVLPPSSLVRTLAEAPLRRAPDSGAPLEATIPGGELVLVQVAEAFGPVMAGGDAWYPVAWAPGFTNWPYGPDDGLSGWMPVTAGGSPLVELLEPRCPSGLPSVASLVGMTGWERVACFGDRDLVLEGSWVAGTGGIVPFVIDPGWLQGPAGGAVAEGDAQVPFVLAPSADAPGDIAAGAAIRIVGHHDDEAARSCTIDLEGPVAEGPAHLFCRQVFVVTAVQIRSVDGGDAPAVGSLAATVVEGVRLRAEPGTAGELLGSLALGASSFVVDGPVQADGYRWWLLAGVGLPWGSGCATLPGEPFPWVCPVWYGWAAEAAPTGDQWLSRTAPQSCPPSEGRLTDGFVREPLTYAACFGNAERTYVGWLPDLPPDIGFGENCPDVPEDLMWIACDLGGLTRLLPESGAETGAGLQFALQPESGIDLGPLRGHWVAVTGRFDHPAAAGCERLEFGWSRAACRGTFVLESIEATTAPS